MNKQLILGDILVNSINNRMLSEIILEKNRFSKNGEIILTFDELKIVENPIILNCKYGNEIIFPEIIINNDNKEMKLTFGFQLDKDITINLI
jgi:hypothetical protein